MENNIDEEEIEKVPCNKCGGTGKSDNSIYSTSEDNNIRIPLCDKCLGDGELDWLEYILGKKKDEFIFGDNPHFLDSIRTVYPKIIAKEMVSISPLTNKQREDFAENVSKLLEEETEKNIS